MRGTELQGAAAAPGIVLVLLELFPPPHTPAPPPRQCTDKGAENKAIPSPYRSLRPLETVKTFTFGPACSWGNLGTTFLPSEKSSLACRKSKKGHPTVGSERDLPATPTAACLPKAP